MKVLRLITLCGFVLAMVQNCVAPSLAERRNFKLSSSPTSPTGALTKKQSFKQQQVAPRHSSDIDSSYALHRVESVSRKTPAGVLTKKDDLGPGLKLEPLSAIPWVKIEDVPASEKSDLGLKVTKTIIDNYLGGLDLAKMTDEQLKKEITEKIVDNNKVPGIAPDPGASPEEIEADRKESIEAFFNDIKIYLASLKEKESSTQRSRPISPRLPGSPKSSQQGAKIPRSASGKLPVLKIPTYNGGKLQPPRSQSIHYGPYGIELDREQ